MTKSLIQISTAVFVFTLFAGFLSSQAFAIDQITLNNGQVVEGTVLSDVPNLYVDIRLVGGDTKRFQKSEVASVDRDVPSRKDKDALGNQSSGFISLLAGGAYHLDTTINNSVYFDYGIKAGILAGQLGESKFGFTLSYDRFSQTTAGITAASNDLNLQLLLMRLNNGGLYFGPNLGLNIATLSYGSASLSDSRFEIGAGFGYEFFMTDGFSIGPDVRYEHVFSSFANNVLKFALAGNFHF